MPDMVTLELAQMDQLKALAMRSHDGMLVIREITSGDLPWLEVGVLLTDMGDKPPLHTFLISPKGVLKDPGYVQSEERNDG